jgi:hypothetical protein
MKAPTKKATISLDFKSMDASNLAKFADVTVVVVVSFPVAEPYQWTGFIYTVIP